MDEPDQDVRLPARKGRGAVRNVRGRYESSEIVPFDDGWGTLDEPAEKLVTETFAEKTRSIITSNDRLKPESLLW